LPTLINYAGIKLCQNGIAVQHIDPNGLPESGGASWRTAI
jgi:hypothetical protein